MKLNGICYRGRKYKDHSDITKYGCDHSAYLITWKAVYEGLIQVHAIHGTSCLLLPFLNATICPLSNLRSINLISSHLSIILACPLISSFVRALCRPPWPFPEHCSISKKLFSAQISVFDTWGESCMDEKTTPGVSVRCGDVLQHY